MAYKVVSKIGRYGSNATLYMRNKRILNWNLQLASDDVGEESWEFLREFFPQYTKDSLVRSKPGSLGIFCFSTEAFARAFLEDYFEFDWYTTIIKVRGYGKMPDPMMIAGAANIMRLYRFYAFPEEHTSEAIITPPKGTVCYKSVRVLT